MEVGAILVHVAVYGMVAAALLQYHRQIQDAIEQFTDNLRGGRGGPGSPMHASPANDAALLGRKRRKRAPLMTWALLFSVMGFGAQFIKATPAYEIIEMWRNIRRELSAPDSAEYWSQIVGAKLPRLAGTVTSVLENEGVSKVMVRIIEPASPEITLVVHNGVNKLKPSLKGSEVQFEGVATDFTKEPFMLTLDVEESQSIIDYK